MLKVERLGLVKLHKTLKIQAEFTLPLCPLYCVVSSKIAVPLPGNTITMFS